MRNEGKAEFKSLLYEFGKLPMFEENWKPTDFNVTKALILEYKDLLDIEVKSENSTVIVIGIHYPIYEQFDVKETIRNVLNVDFYLSNDLTSEISSDFIDFQHYTYVRYSRFMNNSDSIFMSFLRILKIIQVRRLTIWILF